MVRGTGLTMVAYRQMNHYYLIIYYYLLSNDLEISYEQSLKLELSTSQTHKQNSPHYIHYTVLDGNPIFQYKITCSVGNKVLMYSTALKSARSNGSWLGKTWKIE